MRSTWMWMGGLTVLVAAFALAAPSALAQFQGNTPSGQYAYNPVEHDDMGSSAEPDGESTGVFGFPVSNAVIDRNFNGYGDVPTPLKLTGKSDQLAPGCTNAAGTRVSSGQCGIWTIGVGEGVIGTVVPAHTVDVPGFTVKQGNCPGRYGGSPSVILDAKVESAVAQPGAPGFWYDLNHQIRDLDQTTGGLLSQAGIHEAVAGPTAHWAWYGLWQDKNCNGVIDHLQTGGRAATVPDPDNEFVWYGACLDISGVFNPDTVTGGYCAKDVPNPNSNPPGTPTDPATAIYWYIWPDDHFNSPLPNIPDHYVFDQNNVSWDLRGRDRTGESSAATRMWIGGLGYAQWYYDDSIVVHVEIATVVNCKPDLSINQSFDLGVTGGPGSACTFIDVDKYQSWNPLIEPIVTGLKDTLFDTYTMVNDLIPTTDDQGPIQRLANQLLGYDYYKNTLGPQQGMASQLLHHGWAHEPNFGPVTLPSGQSVQDLYVNVRHGTCNKNAGVDDRDEAFFGWCNYNTAGNPAAYAAYQGSDGRGWIDMRIRQVLAWPPPVNPFIGQTLTNQMPIDKEPLPFGGDPGDPSAHRNTLMPGQWYMAGWMGTWIDQTHSTDESVFPESAAAVDCDEDPSQTQCVTYPKDGWDGFLAGGTQAYQGYPNEPCVTYQPANEPGGTHPWRECHPTIDGNIDDADCLFAALNANDCVGEWTPAVGCPLTNANVIRMYALDGTWHVPVIIWHNYRDGLTPPALPDIQTILPGAHDVITLNMDLTCPVQNAYNIRSADHIFLPEGNIGQDIVTVFSATVGATVAGQPVQDTLTDVDYFGHAVI